jgi:hypothetical protein
MQISSTLRPFLRRGLLLLAIPLGLLSTLAVTLVPQPASDDPSGRTCTNRTLSGDYGILITGVAPAGPTGPMETTIGTALRTYDGNGHFSQVDNVHGQVSGAVLDRQGSGTYEVNPNCSGTMTLALTGVPFPIVSRFVIVGGGEEVKEAVISPPPAVVTAVQRRVGR